jgi:hypothetical protein
LHQFVTDSCQRQDGLPIVVPEEFWIGERKLLWQAAHVEEIYECFPTIHLSMADHQNSSQQFTLAIVPQVITYSTYSSRSTAGWWCQVFRNTGMVSRYNELGACIATPKHTPLSIIHPRCWGILYTLAFPLAQLYLRQINVLVGEADPAVCPPMSPCDGFTFGVKPRAQGILALVLRVQLRFCVCVCLCRDSHWS